MKYSNGAAVAAIAGGSTTVASVRGCATRKRSGHACRSCEVPLRAGSLSRAQYRDCSLQLCSVSVRFPLPLFPSFFVQDDREQKLTSYLDLALALSRPSLGQEIHVLFIMIVLATTIFFCHALIRLCMLILRPPPEAPPSIPNMSSPEGFVPVRPIRVHLARDEELADSSDEEAAIEGDGSHREFGGDPEKEKEVKMPPPAYGLWRSSVRVDPNLLHWQRVEDAAPPTSGLRNSVQPGAGPRSGSVSSATGDPALREGPRPPSYMSDDGVEYVVEARARSIAPSHSGVSDIHPAWRPDFAVSEVEWPRGTRV